MAETETTRLMATIAELRHRELIRDLLHCYARSIDRKDVDAVSRIFWPDSDVDFGVFKGSGEEFSRSIIGWLRDGGVETTDHMLGNVVIRIEGVVAHTECYLHAYHRLRRADGTTYDSVFGARYQDRFELRGEEWRIAKRVLIFDWFREYPDTGNFETGSMGVTSASATIGVSEPDNLSTIIARLPIP